MKLLLKVCAGLVGVFSVFTIAQADTLTIKLVSIANSAQPNTVYGLNPGQLVVAPTWHPLLQLDWAKYAGLQVVPGSAKLIFTAVDQFTPSSTGLSAMLGSTLALSGNGPTYNNLAAAGETNYGQDVSMVDADGIKLTITGVGLESALNAGFARTLNVLDYANPSPNIGASQVYGLGFGQNSPVLTATLMQVPAVPEPRMPTLLIAAFVCVAVLRLHRQWA